MENSKRITKAMYYADITAMLKGETAPNGISRDAAIDFIKREVELLSKKNAAKSSKPTATQTANEGYKKLIMAFLSDQADGVTCTEIAKGIPDFDGFNNQKIASLMRQLKDEGKVVKDTVKGKSLFRAI